MIGKLLAIIEFMLIRPVRNYKTTEHISKNDVLRIHSAKCTSFCINLDLHGVIVLLKLSAERAYPALPLPPPRNYDSGIELPF